mmetsp:Transcript_10565/g.35842  ORF Transcript_10565/g.35842 Transcript_10565/m.35842 type:complete len:364 (-) Transcript_10565:412-1503(-)
MSPMSAARRGRSMNAARGRLLRPLGADHRSLSPSPGEHQRSLGDGHRAEGVRRGRRVRVRGDGHPARARIEDHGEAGHAHARDPRREVSNGAASREGHLRGAHAPGGEQSDPPRERAREPGQTAVVRRWEAVLPQGGAEGGADALGPLTLPRRSNGEGEVVARVRRRDPRHPPAEAHREGPRLPTQGPVQGGRGHVPGGYIRRRPGGVVGTSGLGGGDGGLVELEEHVVLPPPEHRQDRGEGEALHWAHHEPARAGRARALVRGRNSLEDERLHGIDARHHAVHAVESARVPRGVGQGHHHRAGALPTHRRDPEHGPARPALRTQQCAAAHVVSVQKGVRLGQGQTRAEARVVDDVYKGLGER